MKKYIVLLLLSAFSSVSCIKDNSDYIATGLMSIVDVSSGLFKADDGVLYEAVQDLTDAGWDTLGRVMISFDLLTASAKTADAHAIRLNGYQSVRTDKCINMSESDASVYGTDPVAFYQLWGYTEDHRMSLCYMFTYKIESSVKHTFDLVYDDLRSNSDTLFFSLHHNGKGETLSNEQIPMDSLSLGYDYVTYDLSDCMPAQTGSKKVISIGWDWYETDDYGTVYGRDTYHYTKVGTISY